MTKVERLFTHTTSADDTPFAGLLLEKPERGLSVGQAEIQPFPVESEDEGEEPQTPEAKSSAASEEREDEEEPQETPEAGPSRGKEREMDVESDKGEWVP